MRRRLLIVLIAAGLAALAAFAVPLLYTTAAERTDRFVSRRTADMNRFAELAVTGSDQLEPEIDAHADLYGDAVAVVDAAGHPIVRRGDLLDGPEVARAIDAALRNQRQASLPDLRPWSGGRVVFARPVGNGIEVSGAVLLLSSRDQAASDVGRVWEHVLFGVLAVAALFATLILLLVRWVLRPITQLEHGLRAVGKGVHSAYVPPQQGPSEVRTLLTSFNRMADAVTESARRQRALIDDTSHQLRNPLMAMRLRMDTLADRLPADARGTYTSMVAEAGRLQVLLDGMRALAVADAAATELAAHPPPDVTCDAATITRDRIEFWTTAARARGVVLVDRTPPGPIPLRCTDTDLEQIVDVLIDNAIKYAPRSTVTVTVGARWPAARGRITVTDNGPGVPESELPHLTERFRRGRSPAHADVAPGGRPDDPEIATGSGLGLAIAERLTTNHGGRLILSRVSPHGLAVDVDLPAGPRPVPRPPSTTSGSDGSADRLNLADSIRADTTPTVLLPGMRRRRAHRRTIRETSTPARPAEATPARSTPHTATQRPASQRPAAQRPGIPTPDTVGIRRPPVPDSPGPLAPDSSRPGASGFPRPAAGRPDPADPQGAGRSGAARAGVALTPEADVPSRRDGTAAGPDGRTASRTGLSATPEADVPTGRDGSRDENGRPPRSTAADGAPDHDPAPGSDGTRGPAT
ncbi:ATP-binding protein [Frankia sp. R82]|uniref:ATP-binding protein n=1 Tax=Frankia sp. R82 TaxID=2950553 RepID=UPI002043619D|nr:ATP-binding protein [Frankia sp. R82]MCM3886740.1 ATP-binding protein [Frankia sp. R82]